MACSILQGAGLGAVTCRDLGELLRALDGFDTAVITQEALAEADLRQLVAWREAQPPWSDFPFVLLSQRQGMRHDRDAGPLAAALGNVTVIERPFHAMSLVSAVRSAVAARRRQQQARDALIAEADAAERLRFALRAGRLGSWELSAEEWEFRASDACKAVFGRAPGDVFGYAELIAAVHPDDRERMLEAVGTALASEGDYDTEHRTVWPDGSVHWAEMRGRAVRDVAGRLHMAGVSLDTTARRAAEEALRRHREELEQMVWARTRELEVANRRLRAAAEERERAETALLQAQKMEAVGQLTGGLAHDFNNLLQAVLASLDLIGRRARDPEQVRKLAAAGMEAAQRGARLTAQLLAFSRTQTLDLAPVAVGELIEGMRDLLARSLQTQVAVRYEIEPGLKPALADSTQLELAILNLAINARDAMPDGGQVTVSVKRAVLGEESGLPAGEYVAVSVSDTGEGMPPEVAARAFEPFFTTKALGKGTGLGLSQVYGIARQSGGMARIASVPGEGTTVTILLPIAGGAVAARALARQQDDRPEVSPTLAGASALVLVVDDDPDVRRALVSWLDTLGYRAAEAADGRSGLLALERLAPDAMVVDYAMPGLTGAEVAAAALRLRPDLPVVIATGYAETAEPEAAISPGMPVLRKPFGMKDLGNALASALAGASSGPVVAGDAGRGFAGGK